MHTRLSLFNRALKTTLVGLIVVAFAVLIACKPKVSEIPFETLMKGRAQLHDEQSMNFEASYEDMDVLIATDPAEAQQIANKLSPLRPGLRFVEIAGVDYTQYLVVAAYLGGKPHSEAAITIERITQSGQDVNVEVSTVEPTVGDANIVHPIHVVRVRRADLPVTGQLVFNLWKGSEVVLVREHFVP